MSATRVGLGQRRDLAQADRLHGGENRLPQRAASGETHAGLLQYALDPRRVWNEMTEKLDLLLPAGLLFLAQCAFADPGLQQALALQQLENKMNRGRQDIGVDHRHDFLERVIAVEERMICRKI